MVHVASQAEVKQKLLRYVSGFGANLLEVMRFSLFSGYHPRVRQPNKVARLLHFTETRPLLRLAGATRVQNIPGG